MAVAGVCDCGATTATRAVELEKELSVYEESRAKAQYQTTAGRLWWIHPDNRMEPIGKITHKTGDCSIYFRET